MCCWPSAARMTWRTARWNTEQEIDTLLTVIPQVVQRLRSMNAHYRACENGEASFLLK